MLKLKKEEISPLGSAVAKRPSGPLEVGTPFYQDGQLQVRVYWKNRGGMHSTVLIYSSVKIKVSPHSVNQSLLLMYTKFTRVTDSQSNDGRFFSLKKKKKVSEGANEIIETMCLCGSWVT